MSDITKKSSYRSKCRRDNKNRDKNRSKITKNNKPTAKSSNNNKTKSSIKKGVREPINNIDIQKSNIIKNMDDDNFRLQSQKIFFTYKHHIPFDKLFNFINNIFTISKYIICHENGDECHNYLHTHMAVEFDKKINVTNSRTFDYEYDNENIHPNIATTRNWAAACVYCLKMWKNEPTDENKNWESNFDVLDYLKNNKNNRNMFIKDIDIKDLVKRVNSYKSVSETIKNEAKDLRDVVPLMAIYNNKVQDVDPRLIKYYNEIWIPNIRPWQQKISDILNAEAQRRLVYWIYEKIGHQGKSEFCTYMDTILKPDSCLTIAASGSLRDMNDVVRNWVDDHGGKYPDIVLFDIPRTFNDDKHTSIYTTIESFKNGKLTCTKYKGGTLKFYPPIVMVFSNWMPEISDHTLSKDRWMVLKLCSTKPNDINAPLKRIRVDLEKDDDMHKYRMEDF